MTAVGSAETALLKLQDDRPRRVDTASMPDDEMRALAIASCDLFQPLCDEQGIALELEAEKGCRVHGGPTMA